MQPKEIEPGQKIAFLYGSLEYTGGLVTSITDKSVTVNLQIDYKDKRKGEHFVFDKEGMQQLHKI